MQSIRFLPIHTATSFTFQCSSGIAVSRKMADNESQAAGDSTAPAAAPAQPEFIKLRVVGQVNL